MSNPFFSFKQFTIRQDHATLKVTTDACLLGASANAVSPGHILDIGTGTGILAIMLAQRFPEAWIEAIEPDPETSDQARRNAENCPWNKRIHIETVRIQDFIRSCKMKYNLIISNPPYHASQLASRDPKNNLARHGVDLTIQELCYAVDKLISMDGWFYVILPPKPFQLLEKELSLYGIHLIERISVFNLPDKPLYRLIGGFSRLRADGMETSLLIMNENRTYTADFRKLLKDFYLAF